MARWQNDPVPAKRGVCADEHEISNNNKNSACNNKNRGGQKKKIKYGWYFWKIDEVKSIKINKKSASVLSYWRLLFFEFFGAFHFVHDFNRRLLPDLRVSAWPWRISSECSPRPCRLQPKPEKTGLVFKWFYDNQFLVYHKKKILSTLKLISFNFLKILWNLMMPTAILLNASGTKVMLGKKDRRSQLALLLGNLWDRSIPVSDNFRKYLV